MPTPETILRRKHVRTVSGQGSKTGLIIKINLWEIKQLS
jgi:hypothetical protein